MQKIDVFNHIFPVSFFERLKTMSLDAEKMERFLNIPFLTDLDVRFRKMDLFGDYSQILSLSSPPIEALAAPEGSPELARIGNDGMADYVSRYPDRFPGFLAGLPMNNPEAALDEIHRAVGELGAVGVQMYTNVGGRSIDGEELFPLFEAMAQYDKPIFLHPTRWAADPDFSNEPESLYEIWWTFGWPYETSSTMARLVFAGLFDRLPKIKIVTHHMGGMIPYFEGRVGPGWDQLGARTAGKDYRKTLESLEKRPYDYFKMFYADTALFGAASATRCGLDFFGVEHSLFASDAPFDPEGGTMYIRETIEVIDRLDISDEDRERIYSGNAKALLGLGSA